MGTADKRLPVTPETKELIDERKRDGVTYDELLKYWAEHGPDPFASPEV